MNMEAMSKQSLILKTPKKSLKMFYFEEFLPNVKDKAKLAESLGVKENNGINKTFISFFNKIDNQLTILGDAMSNVTENHKELLEDFNLLEMEKNKIHVELGTRSTVSLDSEFEASSVWKTVALISKSMDLMGKSKVQSSASTPESFEI